MQNSFVLVPIQILTVHGVESMPRQASYLMPQHYFWFTDKYPPKARVTCHSQNDGQNVG